MAWLLLLAVFLGFFHGRRTGLFLSCTLRFPLSLSIRTLFLFLFASTAFVYTSSNSSSFFYSGRSGRSEGDLGKCSLVLYSITRYRVTGFGFSPYSTSVRRFCHIVLLARWLAYFFASHTPRFRRILLLLYCTVPVHTTWFI